MPTPEPLPRLSGPIAAGDRLIWEPDLPHARSLVEVVGVRTNEDGEVWVTTQVIEAQTDGTLPRQPPGELAWNDEGRVREACIRA